MLRFLTANEIWVYLGLGAVGLYFAWKFFLGFQEWRSAIFGMEKSLAQRKLSAAVSILFLALLFGASEFVVVSFVIPNNPNLVALPTPTLELLLTPTVTLSTDLTSLQAGTGTPSATEEVSSAESNCIPGKLAFISPKAGDAVGADAKILTIQGVVTIPDNFGYYKYEYTSAIKEDWVTIQAGDHIRCADKPCMQATDDPGDTLGTWDISQLDAGDYFLRLVATDNDGKALPACQIPIRVVVTSPSP